MRMRVICLLFRSVLNFIEKSKTEFEQCLIFPHFHFTFVIVQKHQMTQSISISKIAQKKTLNWCNFATSLYKQTKKSFLSTTTKRMVLRYFGVEAKKKIKKRNKKKIRRYKAKAGGRRLSVRILLGSTDRMTWLSPDNQSIRWGETICQYSATEKGQRLHHLSLSINVCVTFRPLIHSTYVLNSFFFYIYQFLISTDCLFF